MRILYIHDIPLDSGKANAIQVLHMCHALSGLGQHVTLAAPFLNQCSFSIPQLIENTIDKPLRFKVVTFPKIKFGGRLTMIGAYLGVKIVLNKGKFDYCIVRNPALINLTLKHNIKTVFESHGFVLQKKFKYLDKLWRRNLISNAQNPKLVKFVAISHALANTWQSWGIPRYKLMVLHDGVDSEAFSTLQSRYEGRKNLNLPLNHKLVLYAGSLYEDRGIETIIRLAGSFQNTVFIVVGGPAQRKDYYVSYAKRLGIRNIVFTGYIPHYVVKEYLFAADVLLMIWTDKVKTIEFCSPLKMFEYMASGRIIVGHGFRTIREVLTDNKTAYLSNPHSYDDLKQKLSQALESKYPNAMAEAARTLAMEQYTWEARARSILEALYHLTPK